MVVADAQRAGLLWLAGGRFVDNAPGLAIERLLLARRGAREAKGDGL